MRFMLLFTFLMVLFTCSTESPIEGSTFPPQPMVVQHKHGIHTLTADDNSNETYGLSDAFKMEDSDRMGNRANYSRMLTLTTTLGYDEWWFLTTRRPQISLKDFPGKPGVATWKEISSSSSEQRKSRNMNGPTAAGVSSSSWSIIKFHHTNNILTAFWITFLVRYFCWTGSK